MLEVSTSPLTDSTTPTCCAILEPYNTRSPTSAVECQDHPPSPFFAIASIDGQYLSLKSPVRPPATRTAFAKQPHHGAPRTLQARSHTSICVPRLEPGGLSVTPIWSRA